jgi:outer membrane protein OmpA-like peptidoglycan-associated protein
MGLLVAGLVGLAIAVFQTQPTSRVVLLPDADGKTGEVIVRAEGQEQRVATAYGSASVNRLGTLQANATDAAQVAQLYGSMLAARPAAPVSFTVFFEFGSAVDIAPVFQPTLDKLRAAMADFPAAEVTVIGHTDRVGTLESNDQLSLQRAQTVRDLILQAGIRPLVLEIAGRGEREPLVPTADEVPEAQNRRVEINLR